MNKIFLSVLLTLVITIMPTMEIQAACTHDWNVDFTETCQTGSAVHDHKGTIAIIDGEPVQQYYKCKITFFKSYTHLTCTKCGSQKEEIISFETHTPLK